MTRFEECLPLVLVHEGGYVNHPKDPGGATNKGITQRTYDAWCKRQGYPHASVKNITDAEVAAIYKAQYWDKVSADDLPVGVDYAVFDYAVNSGPARSAKFLQRSLGVSDDGIIGAQTLAAAQDADPNRVISEVCDNRLAWLKRLKHWPTFGKGWTRRVEEVKRTSLSMASKQSYEAPQAPLAGKGEGDETVSSTIVDMAKNPRAWGAGGGFIAGLGTLVADAGPLQWAVAFAIVIGVMVLAYKLVRS